MSTINIVGMISLDVMWLPKTESKMRLGGIVHACRTLWALGVSYNVYFFAPNYLINHAIQYLKNMNANIVKPIGVILENPAVMLIGNPDETKDQHYEYLMSEHQTIDYTGLDEIPQTNEDFIVFVGEYDLSKIFNKIKGKIHLDIANNSTHKPQKLSSIITSTSSKQFLETGTKNPDHFLKQLQNDWSADIAILKENRGGSRIFTSQGRFEITAQVTPIIHSVGVGDCYNTAFVALLKTETVQTAATLASWFAAEYAKTTFPEIFKTNVQNILQTFNHFGCLAEGIYVPWEIREKLNIYIAAPDFDYLDCSEIDNIYQTLKYHNFSPHRPIKENGQFSEKCSQQDALTMHENDINLLNKCQIIVAVYSQFDSGTFVEIGYARALGKHVILYDPKQESMNLMVNYIINKKIISIDAMIMEVFNIANKIKGKL
jgi:nucleoside 2-deoxyribosyltransferase